MRPHITRRGLLRDFLALPGHDPHAMELPAAIEPERRYLSTIATEVRTLRRERSDFLERSSWTLFDVFRARNVTAAFAKLEWE